MSRLSVREISGKGAPVSFPDGIVIGASASFGNVNYIGVPGQQGFGVGICPNVPSGFALMAGTKDIGSENYGNYVYSDGSVMVWVPAFFYKYGTGSNGLAVNAVDIKGFNDFVDVAAANAAGYALHRAFYNAGAIQQGFFVDKYLCSNNNGIASSIRMGNPLSSAADHNPFSGLNGAPVNAYHGAIVAAKTRGANFFCNTRFIFSALALLSLAHGAASAGIASCAWYDATGVKNFPKGCNNNALGDANDTSLAFVSDGYLNCCKTGSANFLSKTTHNGQSCGVADLNGAMWEVNIGLTSNGTNLYVLKTTANVRLITAGNTLATDAWGSAGIAAMYDDLGIVHEALTGGNAVKYFGSAGQVFSAAVSGNAWNAANAGIPLSGGVGGNNRFGNDSLYDAKPSEACPISGGSWNDSSSAGVWALGLSGVRAGSYYGVGFRSAFML